LVVAELLDVTSVWILIIMIYSKEILL
jgi:hypothetical protein